MNVSIGDRWEKFVDQAVKAGRYGSASEVVREGLRLVEERETKLLALRATLEASIAAGGDVTDQEIDAAIAGRSDERNWSITLGTASSPRLRGEDRGEGAARLRGA